MVPNEYTALSDLSLPVSPRVIERLLGPAVNCLSVPVLILAADGTILAVNDAFVRQVGYSRDELLQRPASVVVPEGLSVRRPLNTHEDATAATLDAMDSRYSAIAQRKDGSRFPVRVYMNWLSSGEGTVGVAALINVSEGIGGALARRDADNALKSSERRFRTLADNAPVMIWMSGPDKLGTWFNRQWLQFVGQPLEHELGAGWVENVHPDDRAEVVRAYETSFDAREPFTMEYRLRRHDGEWRWVLDSGAPNLQDDGGFAGYFGSCIEVTEQKRDVQRAEQSPDRLHSETAYLRREVKDLRGGLAAGRSAAIKRVMEMIDQVAPTDSTVLLVGETGTGKEFLASRIHELSARRTRSMVRVNCAAIPAALIESELFGRERGAFTGAMSRQVGRFEIADRSTMFLDEIGDLPIDVQVKLLRVLEERQFERLGSSTPIRVDARIIAATHRNLEQRIAEGAFREDLFYRLNVFPIVVPPLRERADDIPALVWHFIDQFSVAFNRRFQSITADNMAALQAYTWPGNIRELRNVVERAMILATGETLTIVLPEPSGTSGSASARLEDIERDHIRRVLDATAWRIRGAGGAAERLGLAPTTLESRMTKLGLTRPNGST
jgi:PAS domain S-box-containing protein